MVRRRILVASVLAIVLTITVSIGGTKAAAPRAQVNTTLFCAPMLSPIGGGVGGGVNSGSFLLEDAYRASCLPKALVRCSVQNPSGTQVWTQTYSAAPGPDSILHALCIYYWGPNASAGTYTLLIAVLSADGMTQYKQTTTQFDVQPEVVPSITFNDCALTYDSTANQVKASISITTAIPNSGSATVLLRFVMLGPAGTFASAQTVNDNYLTDGGTYSSAVVWNAQMTSAPRTYALRVNVYSADGSTLFTGCNAGSITVP